MSYLTIGRVATRTGCNVQTIRYYEKEGLLPAPRRSEGGHRLYTVLQVERLVFIRRSRQLGFTMEEIKQLLAIVDGHNVSCELVKKIADARAEDITTKIRDLKKMQRILKSLSDECSGEDVPDCPIIESLQHEGGRFQC